jgi:hypothetical protein
MRAVPASDARFEDCGRDHRGKTQVDGEKGSVEFLDGEEHVHINRGTQDTRTKVERTNAETQTTQEQLCEGTE